MSLALYEQLKSMEMMSVLSGFFLFVFLMVVHNKHVVAYTTTKLHLSRSVMF